MKKIISIVTVIALVLSMSVMAFAAEKPEGSDMTPEALGEYYAALINEGEDVTTVVEEIVADYENGDIEAGDLATVFTTMIRETEDAQAVVTVIEEVSAMLEDMGITIPDMDDVTLPDLDDITLPDIGDITLPGGDSDSDGGSSFLDTILGALGGIGDIIFGGGSSGGDDSNTPSIGGDDTDDLWGDSGDDFNDNSFGDMSVVAVAAVAAVAGAALVLTRKKSDDAE